MDARWVGVLVAAFVWTVPGVSRAQATGDEAPPPRTAGGATFTFKGFVSTTAWAQDSGFAFGNGQMALWPTPGGPEADPWFADGDVRNTRLTLVLDGLEALGAQVGGGVEVDFQGGFNGGGPFSDEQPMFRLRLAHADLYGERWRLRVGQYWAPLLGYIPQSLSHIAFPLGYGAGALGWRFPGVFLAYELADGVQLHLAAMRGSWSATPGTPPDGQGAELLGSRSPGNASLVPQLEAKLDLSGRTDAVSWGAFVVGHFDRKDVSGVGASAEGDALDGLAVQAGARLKWARLSLAGQAYLGRAMGHQFGQITQFGDIGGWGAWGQVGVELIGPLGIFGFYGISDPDDEDVLASGNDRLRNQQFMGMLRWDASPIFIGVEWLHARLLHGATAETATGNQVSASLLYKF